MMSGTRIGTSSRIIAAAAALVAATAALTAQSRWYEPYQKGVKAFELRNFDAAAPLLEQAIAADPKDGPKKYVEGTFRADYYPYYYLGVAYLELRQYEKAQKNLEKAKATLPQSLRAALDGYTRRLASETAPKPPPVGPPPKPAGPAPGFDNAVRTADAALSAKNYRDAVTAYDAAKAADAAEFSRQNLQPKRDEAARGVTGQQLAAEGRAALQRLELKAAEAKFDQANAALPGQKEVTDGLADIRQRRSTYQRLKADAEQDIRQNALPNARAKLEQAKLADPEQFDADHLDARAKYVADLMAGPVVPPEGPKPATGAQISPDAAKRAEAQALFDRAKGLAARGQYADADAAFAGVLQLDPHHQGAELAIKNSRRFADLRREADDLSAHGNAPAARDRLAEARALDSRRFEQEGLNAILERLVRETPTSDKNALRDGLVALMRGDARLSATILEAALSRTEAGARQGAGVHAYLGVAYATEALRSPEGNASANELRQKAVAQFRLALAAQRDYQLSTRVVSPKIRAMFDQARAN